MKKLAQWLALLLALIMTPLIPAMAENDPPLLVRCGGSFVIATDAQGHIWSWGDNRKGQAAYEK